MRAHGYLDLRWSDDVLYVEAFGPFNDEGAKAAGEAYIKLIQNKEHDNFSVIEILQPDSIGTPNTMNEVEKIWHFIRENGCKSLALVYSNEVQRSLAEEFLPEFGRLFSNVTEAEKWVASQRSQ
jgi:hypothetical protein